MKKNVLFIFSLMFILFISCKGKHEKKDSIKTVKLAEVLPLGQQESASFPGKVKAALEVDLSFRISGPIDKITVKEGKYVHKGDVIAELDKRDYIIQYEATKAKYEQVKAEAERIIALHDKESVSDNDYDKAVSGLRQITAKYNAAKNALADTELRAPFDGYVQKVYFDKGEVIGAGISICSFVSRGDLEVDVHIPAVQYVKRDKFRDYTCQFNVYPDKVFPLELISIDYKANLNQLYTMRFRLADDKSGKMPSPGMSTLVKIDYHTKASTLLQVPLDALFQQDGRSYVWVYNDKNQTVTSQQVELKKVLANGCAVITKGLKQGDKIVAKGVYALSNGAKVRVLPEFTETNVGGLL